MNHLNIHITVGAGLYLKDPDATELGRKIITNAIVLIDELGFESFTFKKLSAKISSPESSIYRYFDSKHALLIYLTSWYWSWIEYKIVMATTNIEPAQVKLEKAIEILTEPVLEDTAISHVNEVILNRIIIAESVKAYHSKEVDDKNVMGSFETYKYTVNRVAAMVLEVNPNYTYPRMLVSTVIEGAHQQRFFAEHLPALTDEREGEDSITKFYTALVFNMITTNL